MSSDNSASGIITFNLITLPSTFYYTSNQTITIPQKSYDNGIRSEVVPTVFAEVELRNYG